jgi:hypothetical protein
MIEDATGNQACEHRTLTEQDWTESVGNMSEKAETSGSIRVCRDEV